MSGNDRGLVDKDWHVIMKISSLILMSLTRHVQRKRKAEKPQNPRIMEGFAVEKTSEVTESLNNADCWKWLCCLCARKMN